MTLWGKRAASGIFATLVLSVAVGGGLVLGIAVFCAWIIGAYPPHISYPIAGLACLAPALAAAVAFAFTLRAPPAAAAPEHPFLDALNAAAHGEKSLGGLILASFAAGVLMGAGGRHAGHHRPPS